MKIELFSCSSYRALLGLAGRVFVYAVLLGALAYGMLWGAVHHGPAFYSETGPVEVMEAVFAVCTALVFLLAARTDPERAPFLIVLSTLFFCAVVRESDYFFDLLIGRHAWKVAVALMLVPLGVYCRRNIRQIMDSAMSFISHPSFGVLLSGLLVLIVFSRLFGYGSFWKELIEGPYYRVTKTIVEEGVELMGYFLLLISSFEYWHSVRIRVKHESGKRLEEPPPC